MTLYQEPILAYQVMLYDEKTAGRICKTHDGKRRLCISILLSGSAEGKKQESVPRYAQAIQKRISISSLKCFKEVREEMK